MQPKYNQQSTHLDQPICSVCIANYNGIALIDACVQSVLAQDVDFPIEIVIHDDASTDESVAYIRAHYPDIVLIESTTNVGFCVSNNRMANVAKGKFLLLLNNDATLFPDALRTLYQHASVQTKPAILGLPQYDAQTRQLVDIGSLCDPFLNPVPNTDPSRSCVAMVSGACLWIPRDLWLELGGFPDWFHTIAEDLYLCTLARLRGYSVTALPTSGFRHWLGKSIGGGAVRENRLSSNVRRRRLSERNKSYVMALCYPAWTLGVALPFHVFFLLVEGLVLAAIKLNFSLFRSIYWQCTTTLLKEHSTLREKRRHVQATRRISVRHFFAPYTFLPQKFRLLIKHGVPEVH